MSACASTHTPLCVCMHMCLCVCVWVSVCMRLCIHTHTIPCEIRLICQWCRSSSMINSPACWKQCYSALATCGTPRATACVFQCMCVKKHEYQSRHLVPDALMLYVCWCTSRLCIRTAVCCVQPCPCVLFMSTPIQLCDSDRTDKPLGKPKSINAFHRWANHLWHQWALGLRNLGWLETSFSESLL